MNPTSIGCFELVTFPTKQVDAAFMEPKAETSKCCGERERIVFSAGVEPSTSKLKATELTD